ncbi:MAG: hypothetical protein ACFFDD_14535 [Promethearchaeota archaeon]
MMNRRGLFVLGTFMALLVIQAVPVSAHTPGPMTLDYNFGTQVLSVQVTHSVTDVNTHYIYQVVVEKNSVVVLTRDYTTQNTTSGLSATYSIAGAHGDVLRVTAKCIISGQASDQITVVDPTATPINGGGTWLDMTLIIAVAVVAIGVIGIVFAFVRRR